MTDIQISEMHFLFFWLPRLLTIQERRPLPESTTFAFSPVHLGALYFTIVFRIFLMQKISKELTEGIKNKKLLREVTYQLPRAEGTPATSLHSFPCHANIHRIPMEGTISSLTQINHLLKSNVKKELANSSPL